MFSSCSIGVHGRFSRRAFAPTAEDRPFSSLGRISQGLEKCKSFFQFFPIFVQRGCSAPAGAGRCFRRSGGGGRFRACGRGYLFPQRKRYQKFAKTCGFGIPFPLSTPIAAVRRTVSIRVFSVCADALVHRCAASCVCVAAPSWAIAARKRIRTNPHRYPPEAQSEASAHCTAQRFLFPRGARRGNAQHRARRNTATAETGNSRIVHARAERDIAAPPAARQAFTFFGSLKTVLSFSRKGKNWFQEPSPLSPEARSYPFPRGHGSAGAARSVPPARRCSTRCGSSRCPSPSSPSR